MDVWTVFWRDWRIFNRHIKRFLLARMITPVLYLITFGWGIGPKLQGDGTQYLEFIIPGIMALNTMNSSFNACGLSLYVERTFTKTLEEYLIAPISSFSYMMGKVMSGTMHGLISSAVIWLVAYIFGVHVGMSAWFLLVLILNCVLFSAMGFVVAMLITSFDDMSNFSTYLLLPMSFLCGSFFPLGFLPEVFQLLLKIFPLTHSIYALRSISSGEFIPLMTLGVLLFYTLILLAGGVWSMERVRQDYKSGSLDEA